MAQKRKLQVFVSSTFIDLKEERQAAVEAILQLGHIPAGMELFSAGDQSQMDLIKDWIDQSDVYLLLLGGRYGSIDLATGKSYTHLEYEYAIRKNKPYFAIVITDEHLNNKVRQFGQTVLELENQQKYKEFKNLVGRKIVKYWGSREQIQLAIIQKLSELDRNPTLIGWIPGNEAVNLSIVAEEIARLTKENFELRLQLENRINNLNDYSGLNFDEVHALLSGYILIEEHFRLNYFSVLKEIAETISYTRKPNLSHFLLLLHAYKSSNKINAKPQSYYIIILNELKEIGLFKHYTLISEANINDDLIYFEATELCDRYILKCKILYKNFQSIDRIVNSMKLSEVSNYFNPML